MLPRAEVALLLGRRTARVWTVEDPSNRGLGALGFSGRRGRRCRG